MDRSIISKLVEAFGVQGAAEQILQRTKNLTRDQEDLLREHWVELGQPVLFAWLNREAPEGSPARPYSKLVPRLAEWLVTKSSADPLFRFGLAGRVGDIAHEMARDDLVEHLRGRIPEDAWEQLLWHASGGRVFRRVAQFECGKTPTKTPLPLALVPRPIPTLQSQLFDTRRPADEAMCIDRLRAMATDQHTGCYTLWVLRETGLLKEIVTPEMILDDLPTVKEVGLEGRARVRFHLDLADDLSDHPSFKKTVMKRILGASARGVHWGYLWWEIPEALRDDIGLASIDTERPAPWALASVDRRLTGMDLWAKRLSLAERPELDLEERIHFHRGAALWAGQPLPKVEGENEFFPRIDTAWLISGPLPEDADEAFEARLERVLRGYYHYDERYIWNRLAELPLTPERAKRIVENTLTSGMFYDLDRCDEIAEARGPIQESVPRPKQWDAKVLRAYAHLVGDPAAVSKWFDESIAAGDFGTALHLAIHDEQPVTPSRTEALMGILPRGDLRTLLRLREDHPWLLSDSDVCTAVTTGEYPDDQWSWLGKNLPTYFLPFVEAKAASTPSAGLATELLESLAKASVPPRRLAEIALERVQNHGPLGMPPHKFGRLLGSGKLWEDPGEELVAHVLQERGPEGAKWLVDVVYESCRSNDKIVHAVHAVIANVLIGMAGKGMEKGDFDSARRALTALADLTAPPRLFRKVRALRELPGADTLSLLLDANEGFMRRSDNEQASVDSLLNALATFFSCDSDGES